MMCEYDVRAGSIRRDLAVCGPSLDNKVGIRFNFVCLGRSVPHTQFGSTASVLLRTSALQELLERHLGDTLPNTFLTVGYTEPKAWSFAFS